MKNFEKVVEFCAIALRNGNKLLFCGNGGSAEFSNHIACEFVCKLKDERPALNALSLCSNIALITAIANDFGYENIFSRQLEACAKEGDILFCISTSGNSKNVIKACHAAKKLGVKTVGMCCEDGELGAISDVALISNGDTAQIQEHQLRLGHKLVECIENALQLTLNSGI